MVTTGTIWGHGGGKRKATRKYFQEFLIPCLGCWDPVNTGFSLDWQVFYREIWIWNLDNLRWNHFLKYIHNSLICNMRWGSVIQNSVGQMYENSDERLQFREGRLCWLEGGIRIPSNSDRGGWGGGWGFEAILTRDLICTVHSCNVSFECW